MKPLHTIYKSMTLLIDLRKHRYRFIWYTCMYVYIQFKHAGRFKQYNATKRITNKSTVANDCICFRIHFNPIASKVYKLFFQSRAKWWSIHNIAAREFTNRAVLKTYTIQKHTQTNAQKTIFTGFIVFYKWIWLNYCEEQVDRNMFARKW